MSRFYADLHNGGKAVRRQGHSAHGIRADIRGWRVGVRVVGRADDDDTGMDDVFELYATGGSSQSTDTLIGTIREGDDGRPVFQMYHGARFPL